MGTREVPTGTPGGAHLGMYGTEYPVEVPARLADDRWCVGLVLDVAAVLTSYGFPAVEMDSGDYWELQAALWWFVYGGPVRARALGRHARGG